MRIRSTAFHDGETIPEKYTCDGADISPALFFEEVPEEAKSLAFVMDDPDAPRGTFVHWVLWDLDPSIDNLPEGLPQKPTTTNGISCKQGRNGFDTVGYRGPCPPGKTHRYRLTLYALDTRLELDPGSAEKELEKAMEGHILERSRLRARYGHS